MQAPISKAGEQDTAGSQRKAKSSKHRQPDPEAEQTGEATDPSERPAGAAVPGKPHKRKKHRKAGLAEHAEVLSSTDPAPVANGALLSGNNHKAAKRKKRKHRVDVPNGPASAKGAASLSQLSQPAAQPAAQGPDHAIGLMPALPGTASGSLTLSHTMPQVTASTEHVGGSVEVPLPDPEPAETDTAKALEPSSSAAEPGAAAAPPAASKLRKPWLPEDEGLLTRLVMDDDYRLEVLGTSRVDWELIAEHLDRPCNGGKAVYHRYWQLEHWPAGGHPDAAAGERATKRKRRAPNLDLAARALMKLPDQEGTVPQMHEVIEADPALSALLDQSMTSGTKPHPRWHDQLMSALSHRDSGWLLERSGAKQGRHPIYRVCKTATAKDYIDKLASGEGHAPAGS